MFQIGEGSQVKKLTIINTKLNDLVRSIAIDLLQFLIHLLNKWLPSNVLSGKVFKDIDAITLSSTAKYVILGSLSGFGLMATKLWLFQI